MTNKRRRLRISSEPELTRTLADVSSIAHRLGFPTHAASGLVTCVSELARNILKYAGSGEIMVEEIEHRGRAGLEITAQDRGPGISDLKAALTDHVSTGGTLGLGLPGVRRMVDEFGIESAPGAGTKVVIRKWRQPLATSRPAARAAAPPEPVRRAEAEAKANTAGATIETASVDRPRPGERVSGDLVLFDWRQDLLLVAMIDCLGHGAPAHLAALRAGKYLRESWSADLAATLLGLHAALQGTVGAVAGLAVIHSGSGALTFAGIGNVRFRLFGSRDLRLESVAGTLGRQIRSPKIQQLHLAPNDTLVAYTDGVRDSFQYKDYPQLRYQNVRLVAGELVARFGKEHDDAACAVVRYRK